MVPCHDGKSSVGSLVDCRVGATAIVHGTPSGPVFGRSTTNDGPVGRSATLSTASLISGIPGTTDGRLIVTVAATVRPAGHTVGGAGQCRMTRPDIRAESSISRLSIHPSCWIDTDEISVTARS